MESIHSSPLLYNLALTLIHFLWQGCLIAFALKILLSMTSNENASTRYNLSIIALLACLVAPIATYISLYQPIDSLISIENSQLLSIAKNASLSGDKTLEWYQNIIDSLPYLSILWMSTVCLLASKLFIELYSVNQLPKQGTSAPNEALQKRFNNLVHQLSLTKTPRLLISVKTKVPMAIGWLKPVVLLPMSMVSGLSPAQLDMLILHELAHIRRHDYLVNLIQTFIETALFFHPAVSWISKQIRNEREYCSDDIAVAASGNPIAYAHTLADTASLCNQHRHQHHTIPTMAMAASGGDLKQRVVRLVKHHHCTAKDDSGKFIASLLIIVSIISVALQPYFNRTFIDLTSGRISFLTEAKSIIQQQPTNAVNLSTTSIAKLLLSQDKTKISIAPEKMEKAPPLKEVQQPVLQQIADVVAEEAVIENIALADKQSQSTEITLDEATTSVQSESVANIAITPSMNEQRLNTPLQSSSELAFERIDASNNTLANENPYSAEIASLSQEVEKENINNSPIKTNHNNQPKYTITKAPQTKVIAFKPNFISAEILSSPDPRYPSIATRKGIEIDIAVNFIIDTDGRVKELTFEQKNKVGYFRSAIRSALAKWRFLPAQRNGKPVETKMKKIFSFSLMK